MPDLISSKLQGILPTITPQLDPSVTIFSTISALHALCTSTVAFKVATKETADGFGSGNHNL